MRQGRTMPSYSQIFGALEFREVDEGRSVYSPAAYLAELLDLVRDTLGPEALIGADRRSDITAVPLDGEHTFTERPYLEVVNRILGTLVDPDARATMAALRAPLTMPFDLHREQLAACLSHLKVDPVALYTLFAPVPDPDVAVQVHLGLSADDAADLTTVVTDAGELARTWYGIEGASSTDGLADVTRFLRSTRLSPAELRELLHADAGHPATGLFIHAGGPCVTIDAAGTRLLWDGGTRPIPATWYERVNRLVRLSRRTGLSLSDADLVLRCCCANRLDAAALRTVAAVVHLHRTYALPVDVAAALLAPIDTLGDGTGAPSLFERLVARAPAVPAVAAVAVPGAPAAAALPRWSADAPMVTGDVLAAEHRDARLRIARGLGLSEADLIAAVTAVRNRTAAAQSVPLDVPALSLLHRVAVLSRALDVSVTELFAVLDALTVDASIGTPTDAGLLGLLVFDASTTDPYRMLAAPDVPTALCLTRLLTTVVPWLRRSGIDAAALADVLGGATTERDGDSAGAVRELLDTALGETGLTPGTFVSDRFSARASRVVHDVLVRSTGVVSPSDSRVLQLDPECLAAAAYVGLADLPAVTEEDLRGIGLAPRLAGKIFTNLVLAGYLDAAGTLVAEALPVAGPGEEPAAFGLWTDFDALRERVHSAIAECLDTGRCYPSDIAALGGLDPATQAELYDNLVVNSYLDAGGTILDPDFFATPDSAAVFAVTVDLTPVAGAVLDLLRDVARRVGTDQILLDEQVLVPSAPGAEERAELLASLRFNGHLDAAGRYVDPAGLRALGVESFPLAVRFHRRRAEILRALHSDLDVARAAALTLAPESFAEIADDAAAAVAARALDGSWLVEDLVPEEMRALVAEPDAAPSLLGAEWEQLFSAADRAALGHRIATILAEQQAYRVDVAALADLGFTADELPPLLDVLVAAGHLDAELTIPEERVAWFATATNALGFVLPGLEDCSADIFGVLHGVATQLTAALAEVTTTVTALAERQQTVLVAALQDALGLPPDVVAAICAGVAGSEPEALELLVAPAEVPGAEAAARRTYARIRRFALLAGKLGLDAAAVRVAFHDQDLGGRFAEPMVLPSGVDRVDALLERADGERLLFRGTSWWSYAPGTTTPGPDRPLAECSPRFAALAGVDAAFVDDVGTEWVVGHDAAGASRTVVRAEGNGYWTDREQAWGAVRSTFAVPATADVPFVDAAFVDRAGRVYLFRGSQYVRYTGTDWSNDPGWADEGYPRTIGRWWEGEDPPALGGAGVPARFQASVDAAFNDRDGITHLFSGDRCLAVGDEATSTAAVAATTGATGERTTAEVWGRVRNTLAERGRPDAVYAERSATVFVCGDQVLRYSDCIENAGVRADEGFPLRVESYLRDVPAGFETGLSAVFADGDDVVHLFKENRTVALHGAGEHAVEIVPTAQRWGVLGPVLAGGAVDSALLGRDGRTYLFSGDRYVRYSGTEYGLVDPGFPRAVVGDWGGLRRVDASFVLDGATYLFGTTAESSDRRCVRYSTNDYTTPDAGYPQLLTDGWWNLPGDGPAEAGVDITDVDAVFTADGRTYWFWGEHFVVSDAKRRWWSDVRTLAVHWDSLPFPRVDAAFVGVDGRTYVFCGTAYARYSDGDRTRLDDRYPAPVATMWGRVANTIARSGRVDAALVVDAHTYLFSGGQYVRYDGPEALTASIVSDGYPKPLAELRAEPRFAHLPELGDVRVEAAYADRRTVHLFVDGRCHVASAELYHRYEGLGSAGVGCAFVEGGSVLVEEPGGWRRYSALEGTEIASTAVRPRTLRTVPVAFRSGLDAVLNGTDGHTYLFKGTSCYDATLRREYPLAEDWGRARNAIHDENVVDAAFVGTDGRTYVFAGDQYVVYAAPAQPGAALLDTAVVGGPRSIAAEWGGLDRVALAYVHAGVTYLFETPDATGAMRCLAYSSADRTTPDEGYPRIVRADHWGIPAAYLPAGFVAPDAVLVEGPNMFLLTQGQFLALHEPSGVWSPPRPVRRLLPGLDVTDDPLDDTDSALPVTAAFTGPDGATYVFTPGAFTRHVPGGGAPVVRRSIGDLWGRSPNAFVAPGGRVDAAVVDGAGTTFLFSGDQYTRYSGTDYRYADPGYPKAITGHLRAEEAFANLPAAFEDAVAARRAAGPGAVVDAVVANPRTVYLFLGADLHVVSRTAAATYELAELGRVRNTFAEQGRVDAALVDGAGATFLFSGDQYVRYSTEWAGYVDDGYPRSIETSLARDLGVAELPVELHDGIDAAFRDPAGATHLFVGPHWLRVAPEGVVAPLRPAAETWGRTRNTFTDTPGRLDAAFTAPTGELYAFRGDQYVRYAIAGSEHVDEGFPRRIKDSWGDLPPSFEQSVDAAFTLAGRTYLALRERYVRYSDAGPGPAYRAVDRTYPQTYAARWAPGADYRLSDVLTVGRFAELARAHDGLAALLAAGPGTHPDPYAELAARTGWDAAEARWLVRRHGFLPAAPDPDVAAGEERVEIELLGKLADAFALGSAFGAGPSTLHAEIWTRLHGGTAPDVAGAAAAVASMLQLRYDPADVAVLARQLRDELTVAERDALVSVVLARTGAADTQALFEQLLIDVDMGAQGSTSEIREAIAATQLFVHRYLLDLETGQAPDGPDAEEVARKHLRTWWSWMRTYRTWEANRKVFLYPENYLRPELRPTKTPAFAALEDDLLRTEITPETAQQAYMRYLDEYTEVSRLAIAGGYVYAAETAADPGVDTRDLVLFGRTRTQPRRYYYRRARFGDGENLTARWEPWLAVNVQINADQVYPVHAFGRVFVFWTAVESMPPPTTSSTTVSSHADGDDHQVTAPPTTEQVRVRYSFLNLIGEWVAAQTLTTLDTRSAGSILDVELELAAAGDGETESIAVTCTYTVVPGTGLPVAVTAARAVGLTPELVEVPLPPPALPIPPAGADAVLAALAVITARATGRAVSATGGPHIDPATDPVREILTDPEADEAIAAAAGTARPYVVRFASPAGSEYASWFSVDHKGGSFLCRPAAVAPGRAPDPVALAGNTLGLPAWARIDAAVETPDGVRYFFDNAGGRYAKAEAGRVGTPAAIAGRFGRVAANLTRTGVVDAVLRRGKQTYVFSGSQYLRYAGDPFGPVDGGPFELATNTDGFPRWERIDAAFTDLSGTEWFCSTTPARAVRGDALAALLPASEVFGRFGVAPFGTGALAAAFVDADAGTTYLFSGSSYVRCTGGSNPKPDGGPKPIAENAELPRWAAIGAALRTEKATFYFDDATQTYLEVPGALVPQGGHPGGPNAVPKPDKFAHPTQLSASLTAKPSRDLAGGATTGGFGRVDAAYVEAGPTGPTVLYVIGGDRFARYTLAGGTALPAAVDDGYPKPMPVRLTAVFRRGPHRYAFSGGSYTRLQPGVEPDRASGFRPIEGNWADLPDDLGTLTGLLDSDSDHYLYLFLAPASGAVAVRYLSTVAVPRPFEQVTLPLEVIRLTTSTAAQLNRKLLTGGVASLLEPASQELDELPAFRTDRAGPDDRTRRNTIVVRGDRVAADHLPTGDHLDFASANGGYYWEIFFHAPMLIAGALNAAQRFAEARQWYEYVFDPTEPTGPWRFLPFLAADLPALAQRCRADVAELAARLAAVDIPGNALLDQVGAALADLETLVPAFQARRTLAPAEKAALDRLATSPLPDLVARGDEFVLGQYTRSRGAPRAAWQEVREALAALGERVALITGLRRQYQLLGDPTALVEAYHDDPFEPHAIADLRPVAHRRAVVMAYIDNLLDWGDLLFRQYTGESIDEARMLYVLAWDLLGPRPESPSPAAPADPPRTYAELDAEPGDLDLPAELTGGGGLLTGGGAAHAGVASTYFQIPENADLAGYWDRVADRLRKIRQSLDIMGVRRPLPLFEPPLDPMSLVRAVAGGADAGTVASAAAVPVPHYRFEETFRRAQELTDRLRQLGSDLLSVTERKEADDLTLLANRQEGVILDMTRAVQDAQVQIAEANLRELQVGKTAVDTRVRYYQGLIDSGMSDLEKAQLGMMYTAAALNMTAGFLKIGSAIAYAAPQIKAGPFIMGIEWGGKQGGKILEKGSEISESLGEGFSMLGEALGVQAQNERSTADWKFQLVTAEGDRDQLVERLTAAELGLAVARRQAEIFARQVAQQEEVAAYLKSRFTGTELYRWMMGELGGHYFRAYHLAHDMARAAERAFRFERGRGDAEVDLVRPAYWQSLRGGLLAGDALGADLDALANAFRERGGRGLEITKKVSLIELDPLALVRLNHGGSCDFAVTEEAFDHDFPGHFRRQLRTVAVSVWGPDGQAVEVTATLTQLSHKTVLEPDVKAVRHLLDPTQPVQATIRSDWRAGQQIALSHTGDAEANGLFELRYDDARYLPFEGTGAISTWRLELSGYRPADLQDVTVTLRYTAEQGGETFANAVRGMLQPYAAARFFDLAADFPQEWQAFRGGDELSLPLTPAMLPGIVGQEITGVLSRYQLADGARAQLVLNGGRPLPFTEGQLVPTPGLQVSGRGGSPAWTFTVDGDGAALRGVGLVLTYQANPR